MTKKRDFIAPKQICTISVAVISLTIGIGLLHYKSPMFQSILEKGLELSPGSNLYENWKETKLPIYLEINIFNWTNPDDIFNASVKPKFEEIGPFRFRETITKVNLTWNKNGTVSYYDKKTWVFERESSVGDLDMNITTLNTVSVSGVYQARLWNFWPKKMFQMSLSQLAPKIHVTKTIGELTFFGYEDPFVNLVRSLPITGTPEYDKVGWFYGRNNSIKWDGHRNMDSNFEHLGRFREWNGRSSTGAYNGECGKVRGSTGAFYKRSSNRTKISFFSTDLCREVALDYMEDVSVFGFHGLKFSASKSFLDSGTYLEENQCYCSGECIPYGVLNISHCAFDAPSFISLPHFYKADPYYTDKVEGMKPSEDLHDFYIVVEPNTGTPISVAARLQFNLLIQPVQYITLFEEVPKVYFPVMWFQQRVDIPADKRLPMKILLTIPLILEIIGFVLTTCGLLVLIYDMYSYYINLKSIGPKTHTDIPETGRLCHEQENDKTDQHLNNKSELENNILLSLL